METPDHDMPARPIRRRGKRTLTPAMQAARDELATPALAWPEKYDVLKVLGALPRAMGLTRAAWHLLIRMVEKTPAESWLVTGTPFIYAHNATLMGWTGLSLSSLRRAMRELTEALLLVACDGRNGQRGRRWQGEGGEKQVGFNLASLRYRWPQLLNLLEDERRRRSHVAFLRDAIADLNNRVRVLAEACDDQATAIEAARLLRLRLRTENLDRLGEYHDRLKELWHQVRTRPRPVDNPVQSSPETVRKSAQCTPKMAPMGPKTGTHYTESKNNQPSDVVVVAAKGRNRIETMRRAGHDDPDEMDQSRVHSALGGFKGTAMFYLTICPALRDLCPTSKPTQADLADAAERLSGQIGVSWRAWTQACAVMGRFEAGVAIIVMAARVGRGEVIRFRDAYFRALVDRSARHTLFLDRSLYALRDIHAAESGVLAAPRPL